MKTIPPLDLTRQYQTLDAEVSAAVVNVLRSGQYIGGQAVTDFEAAFAAYHDTAFAVGCNSGTDALYLALRALNIGPGDEVITSPFTFIATAETISEVGATPVFVDIEPETFNLDPIAIAAAITPRTKAIMPVHLFGRPADMTAIGAIATQHELPIIEDCAQAAGAVWQGQKVGTFGIMGCFSFFPTKNLGACGDGGAVITQDAAIAAQLRMLREHGQRERYTHDVIGVNSRLDAIQATILAIKLRYLDQWNRDRATVAARYDALLQPLPEILRPTTSSVGQSVWNQYTIRVPNRDAIREYLRTQDIIAMIYYPKPLHLQPVYAYLGQGNGSFPHAEQAAQEVLSVPMFPELSAEEQERVVYALKDALMATTS